MKAVQVSKVTTLTGHRDCVYALEGVPSSPVFFSGSGDGMITRWTLGNDEGEAIATMGASVYALRHDPVSGMLLAGHNFEGVHFLDWELKKEVKSIKFTDAAIFDLAITGRRALVAAGDGTVTVLDIDQFGVVERIPGSGASARCIAIHPGGAEVAIGYSDNRIRVFRLKDFSEVCAYEAHANSVFTLRYTPDGRWLLSGSRDARLKAWEVDQKYSLYREVVAHLFAINDLCFSPDNKHFVTCSMDKSVKVWRLQDLTLLKVIDKARHAGHGTSVNKVLWPSYTNQIISASDDRTISIWDVIF